MSRVKKAALAIFGVLIALAVLVAVLGPSMVQDTVETQLRERLERRGIDAQWQEFNAGFGKRFEIKGLHLKDPQKGIELHTDTVLVVLSIDSLIANDPRLEKISLTNLEVTLDLAAEGDVEPDPEPTSTAGKPKRKGLLERVLEDPPAVQIEGAKVHVVRGDKAVLDLGTESARVSIDGDDIKFETVVVAQPLLAALPKTLRTDIEGKLAFEFNRESGHATFDLRHPEIDRPLVSYSDDEVGAMRLGAILGSANVLTRSVDFEFEYLSGRVGTAAAPSIAMDVPKVLVGMQGDSPKLTLEDASVVLTPKKREQIMDTLRAARALFATEASGATAKGSARSPVDRLVSLVERSNLSFRRVRASVNIEGEEPDTFTQLTVLERLDATAKDGRFRAFGETAEGTFSAEAVLAPGQTVPQYLRVEVAGVNLDKIPGMPKERSKIPSRGTSGRLGGVISGQLTMFGPPRGAATAGALDRAYGAFDFAWDDGVIDLTGVSEEALTGIDITTEGEVSWYPALNEVMITDGRVKYGPIKVNFSSEVFDVPLDTTFVFRAEMEEIECEKAIRAFPRALLGPYRYVEVEGEFAPKVYFKLPIYRPRALRLGFEDYEDLCEIKGLNVRKRDWPAMQLKAVAPTGPHKAVNGFPDDYEPNKRGDVYWLNRPFVKQVHEEGVSDPETVQVYVGPGTASYVPLEQMPSYVGGAMYLSEQMLFYTGPAISISLIKKALRLNLERGRFVYGGSTITQQLVKNLFLSRDKTLTRKLQEAIISWRIIETISRDRILELYLNCIEFGPDIYGIGPAAQYYFQKDARDLSAREAIFLSMLKPAPWYGAKVIERKKSPSTGWWAERFELMYQRLIDEKMFTKEQAAAEKPYILEWDANGKYINPAPKPKSLPALDLLE